MFCCFRKNKKYQKEKIDIIPITYHCENCNFESRNNSLVNKHKKLCFKNKGQSIYDDTINLQRYQNF